MRRAEVVALGLIQGPAELLPVSSSGHVAALPLLLGWEHAQLEGARRKEVEVALHAGGAVGAAGRAAAGADGAAARRRACSRWCRPSRSRSRPSAGSRTRLGGPRSLAGGLVAGSVALVLADRRPGQRLEEDAGPRDGVLLGLAQACALVPGVSRAGATLAAARALGFARPDAVRLSRGIGVPVLAGAAVLKGAAAAAAARRRASELATLGAGRADRRGGDARRDAARARARARPAARAVGGLPLRCSRASCSCARIASDERRLRAFGGGHERGRPRRRGARRRAADDRHRPRLALRAAPRATTRRCSRWRRTSGSRSAPTASARS